MHRYQNKSINLYRKRRTAAAGGARVGIADHELLALQTFGVIDLRTHQVLEAHGVDQQGPAALLHRGVTVDDGHVKSEAVLKAGAAAAGDEIAQLECVVAFLVDQLLYLTGRRLREYQRGFSLYCVRTHCCSPR